MKKLTVIITSILISLPIVASAKGGYQWEKRQNAKEISVQHLGNSDASRMGHTAVQHKRWVFDDRLTKQQELEHQPLKTSIRTGEHANHTAAQHKYEVFGSN